jgi:hypothetical protein
MPLDEIAGAIVGEVVGKAAGVVVDVSLQLIFNKYVARYFHGIGRHILKIASVGMLNIPSSLREVPKGTRAKPNALDWLALVVGVAAWFSAAAAGLLLWK